MSNQNRTIRPFIMGGAVPGDYSNAPPDPPDTACCDTPSPSTHEGQPYCESCDTDLPAVKRGEAQR